MTTEPKSPSPATPRPRNELWQKYLDEGRAELDAAIERQRERRLARQSKHKSES